ncbi:hypothetical protein QJS83_03060 [Bdellovibrio sp. 22V]|uniref:hypothetical protein n=1 Tax=Bdellovibrio TaxID=958 RepID=UPI002543BB1F|nr:hypothetical protein [Bdellovibrio sp. 22V]WII72848.1 hypothetical protein QJS83_03060 [Bdellovibrio sp. 22V]
MKRLVFFLFALFLVACQGNDNGGGNAPVTTPLSMSCINGSAYCNNNIYYTYRGFIPYPGLANYAYNYMGYFNQYGFCGCPAGYQPVYNGVYGLGCMQTALLVPTADIFFYWTFGGWGYTTAAPQASINIPQYSNIPSASNSVSSCSRNLTQSCLLDNTITCGAGATCRQAIAGSNLGVCVQN